MIVFKNGKIYVEVNDELIETTNPEMIGMAVLDFNDENEGKQIELVGYHTTDLLRFPGCQNAELNVTT